MTSDGEESSGGACRGEKEVEGEERGSGRGGERVGWRDEEVEGKGGGSLDRRRVS